MTPGEAGGPPLPPLPQQPLRASPLPQPLPPAPLRLEMSFVYTFEELREGLTQSPDVKPVHEMRRAVHLVVWVLFVALVALLSLLLRIGRPAGTAVPGSPGPRPIDGLMALLPSLLSAAFVAAVAAVLFVSARLLTSHDTRVRERLSQVLMGGGVLLFLMLWGSYQLLASVPQSGNWPVSRAIGLILALAPWVILLTAGGVFLVRFTRRQLRRQWENKPYLRRRRTIVLDGDGERSADGITEMLYRWPYFRRAWETENCLVLQDENDLRHILPKRVMDRPTLDQARAVISNHVADCKFLTTPGGFPVATPAPPAA